MEGVKEQVEGDWTLNVSDQNINVSLLETHELCSHNLPNK
jgi:hypothetical protein